MSKYRNKPTEVDGIRFASKAEAARYADLKLMERAGVIMGLKLQPRYPLHAADGSVFSTYVADFEYFNTETMAVVTEDVKGVETQAFKLKKRAFEAEYGRPIKLVKRGRVV